MARSSYSIIVPSRQRVGNMERILALLPTARVCVEESEVEAYAQVVPGKKLLAHPPLVGMGAIMQWILEHCKTQVMVNVDDDLRCVRCQVGRRGFRAITEPSAILRIIENSITICEDLGLKLFCWDRQSNPMYFRANDPVALAAPASCSYGIVGRDLAYDTNIVGQQDVDLTLRVLRDHRIVYCDRRFYFDHGDIWGGAGGLQGVRTAATHERDLEIMTRRWGPYLDMGGRKKRGTTGMSLRVRRRSQVAATRGS